MPATPHAALPYPTPADPVALGANDIRALAEKVDPHLFGLTPSTTPPAAPANGTLWLFPVGDPTETHWAFRWNGTHWAFIGGGTMTAYDAYDFVIAAAGWYATPTPGIIAPFVGHYYLTVSASGAAPADTQSHVNVWNINTGALSGIPGARAKMKEFGGYGYYTFFADGTAYAGAANTDFRWACSNEVANTSYGHRTISLRPQWVLP